MKWLGWIGFLVLLTQLGLAAEPMTLKDALDRALEANPEVASFQEKAKAEHAAVRAQYAPERPRFGLMHEKGMNDMELREGPMNLWSVSQEFKFPVKYFLLADAQRDRANSADEEASAKRLEVRRKVISAYYSLFSAERIIQLLSAQRETMREIARIAETRHATGAVPQQDEMKAHVEETKIDNALLSAQEEKEDLEARFNALLDNDPNQEVAFPAVELSVPKLSVPADEIAQIAHHSARHVRHGRAMVAEAQTERTLSKWDYAPDFNFFYRKAYANGADGNFAAGVELSIPLWFPLKESSDAEVARHKLAEAERNLDATLRDIHAEIRGLTAKVKTHAQLLQIYQTALIPQTTSTLNSSRASYRAGRSSFTDLLDSERSVYEMKIAYYRTLSDYVEDLSRLEEMVGSSLSSLPFGENL